MSVRYRSLAALALSLALAVPPAFARSERVRPDDRIAPSSFEYWTEGRAVDVQVRVDDSAVPLYDRGSSDDRRYLQAREGASYSIVLRNVTTRRIGVVLAVDGLNVVNGRPSSGSRHEDMYVLDPNETTVVRGWRTSLDEVRRFVFVDEARSYAERTGQANADMGWIRVTSFREQRSWWETRDRARVSTPDPFAPRAAAPEASGERAPAGPTKAMPPMTSARPQGDGDPRDGSTPGTGWGERREDHVTRVEFVADRRSADRHVLRYEYASGLRALGIRPLESRWRDRLAERDHGFARPPMR